MKGLWEDPNCLPRVAVGVRYARSTRGGEEWPVFDIRYQKGTGFQAIECRCLREHMFEQAQHQQTQHRHNLKHENKELPTCHATLDDCMRCGDCPPPKCWDERMEPLLGVGIECLSNLGDQPPTL
jgi:hypothetical protein